MLRSKIAHGLLAIALLGMNVATARAECNGRAQCNGVTATTTTGQPVVSYDSPYYGFTVGVYGAPQPPFITSDVTTLKIEPQLPEGLKFNVETGAIFGTPTEPSQGNPAYVVRAYDADGHSSATVIRIAINPSPNAITTPTATPTATPRVLPSPSASPSATPTGSPSASPSASPSLPGIITSGVQRLYTPRTTAPHTPVKKVGQKAPHAASF